jgi:hypothetical protein
MYLICLALVQCREVCNKIGRALIVVPQAQSNYQSAHSQLALHRAVAQTFYFEPVAA